MLSQAFNNFNGVSLSVFGMLLFVAVFIGVLAWLARRDFSEASQIPFNEEAGHE
jgi:hypothetical protein